MPPTDKSPTISLCMIVRNEEASLKRCLDSIRGFVDEIIIVDTGSTDKTRLIARSFGATILDHKWQDDFSLARNAGLDKAGKEWILVLDADEELDAGSCTRVRDIITDTPADGFRIVVRNFSTPGDLLQYEDAHLTRLFRHKPAYRYEQVIHEQIRPSIERNGGIIRDSDITILHYGYASAGVQGGDQRAQRNVKLLEKALASSPNDAFLLYHAGCVYKSLGKQEQAITFFEKALTLDLRDLDEDTVASLHMKMAQLKLAKNQYLDAIEQARKCLVHAPNNPICQLTIALAHLFMGNVHAAYPRLLRIRLFSDASLTNLNELDALLAHCRRLMETGQAPEKPKDEL